ncbi:MAG TPA: 4'-phosphopantetheinyl transferase superfamily protein [Ktedonobacterales bacterium]|nr:4'-phosphopantetheinyl transferase superfamily protein [Ktedonobacterales bacterium]
MPAAWAPQPRDQSLQENEIHVWAAPLEQPALSAAPMLRALSSDERSHAERFYFPQDRRRYVIAHGFLRAVLARYLRVDPVDVLMRYLPSGKPELAPEWSGERLHFNLSHSHELALCAVGRGRSLGVDVEWIRAGLAVEGIAERLFAPREAAALRILPRSYQTEAFFTCWTLKEAYVKARGAGLQTPLNQFEVALTPGQLTALLFDATDQRAASRWSLQSLDVGGDYAAALAVEGRGWRLQRWVWTGQEYR